MADSDMCEVTEMLKATCVHCRPPAERARLNKLADDMVRVTPAAKQLVDVGPDKHWEDGPVVTAKLSGRCPRCKETFDAGEPIRLSGGRWTHAEECS